MNIDYPGELQIKQSICEICDKGIKKPDTCFSFIKNMTKNFGFEKIFHGVYCVIFICFLENGLEFLFRIMYNTLQVDDSLTNKGLP